ncbi:GNAT family N-acetyltransferase [Caldifermentibacillus hisashii]|uniref:GNAT family N-acetyltransferase n=1 Tax=Caldifermentibacillus hisashii TaxID=996558 RepID=UPI0022B9C8FA|nr:GNAT family N-acetyltransferase [Caldifermentibacillus hisashii]
MSVVSEIVIENLKEEDKTRYAEVLVESYSQYEKDYTSKETWENYKAEIRDSVNNPNAETILVAKKGNEILGGLQLFIGSEKAYNLPELNINSTIVRLLGVHPNGRGHGIAKKLLNESFKFARLRGDEYLYLHSTDIMNVAIQLYLKLGFVRDETKDFDVNGILVKSFKYKLSLVLHK